ncbi:MAG: hypothetical protein JXR57_15390 [Bacteroidales bacterium]|nr:hypothetical protein [Bacteroidales bacterium]
MYSYKRLISYSLFFSLFWIHCNAQEVSGEKIVQNVVNSARMSMNYAPPLQDLSEIDLAIAIKKAQQYSKDTSFDVRWNIALMADRIMWQTHNITVQQEVASTMITFMNDDNSRLEYLAEQSVMRYPPSIFNEEQKSQLIKLAESSTKATRTINLFKLCARIKADGISSLLQKNAENKNNSFRIRWASLISLTRIGNSSAEIEVINYIDRFPLSLDVIDMLYPDIIFSRSQKAITILINQLIESKEMCESSNPNNNSQIPCGYMILRILGPHIKDINWSGKNGLENFKPEEALKKARAFFINKGDSWELIEEK